MSRLSKDDIGLRIAYTWSLRGTCARRQVGCLLVDKNFRTLSSGYNGVPSGAQHCIDKPCSGATAPSGTGLDLCQAIHAEQNALLYCPDVRLIDTCYTTASPCMSCVKLLLGTNCRRIVFDEEYPHPDAKTFWEQNNRIWWKLSNFQKP
jgi:dCMP deaminase